MHDEKLHFLLLPRSKMGCILFTLNFTLAHQFYGTQTNLAFCCIHIHGRHPATDSIYQLIWVGFALHYGCCIPHIACASHKDCMQRALHFFAAPVNFDIAFHFFLHMFLLFSFRFIFLCDLLYALSIAALLRRRLPARL